MPDYQNGVIYVIYVGEQKYVGSTCDLQRRKRDHQCCLNHPFGKGGQYKLYQAIRENGGEWRMEIYKQFPCDSKLELELEEERIRKELAADLNKICCATALTKVEYDKQRYQNNKEKVSEQGKQYREQNKDKYREQRKQYRENNRENIREKANQKIECPICGLMITRSNKARHQRLATCKRIAEQRAEEVGSS